MVPPRRIPRIVKFSPLAFLVLGLVMAGPATAAPFSPAGSIERANPPQEVKATLSGPRQVVVRDLPPVAGTATGQAQEVLAPRTFPPEWAAGPLSPPPAANALDAAFSGESDVANTPPSVSSLAQWEGLDNDDNAALTPFTITPPDPQGAVGPDHVLELINIVGRIYTRTGGTVQTFTLADFFAVPDDRDFAFDPKIIYDALSGRWFASSVSILDRPGPRNDEGRLHLAISETSNPTGAWSVYFRSYGELFPDYAGIGVTNDKFTISSNIFHIDQPFYFGEETVVIEKAHVMAGVAGGQVGVHAFAFDLNRSTVRPAHSLSPVNDQYLVTRSRTSSTTLTVIRITGTPALGNVSEASATDLTIISQTSPPDSEALGGNIDSNDFRILDAMWREGSLWTSASAACVPEGDSTTRSCAHLIEVNALPPSSPTIAQDIMFGASGEYFSWPAVRTAASGDVYVSLTHTNSTIFAEARAAGRLAGESPNTMSGSSLLRAGDVAHGSTRWGDYLAAAVDPNFPECVWLIGQYAKDTLGHNWGTYIAATSYSGGCDSDNDGFPDGSDNCPAASNPLQQDEDSEGLGDACDPCPANPDCDGDTWSDWVEIVFIGTDPLDDCADDPTDDALPVDFNNDTFITAADLSTVAAAIGQTVPPALARKDIAPDPPDGAISGADLSAVAGRIGQVCTP